MKKEFKVGDEVKVISNEYGNKLYIGRIGIIVEFDQNNDVNDFPYFVHFNDIADSCAFAVYELELVEKFQVPSQEEIPENQVQVYKDGKLQWVHILDINNYNLGYNEELAIKKVMSSQELISYGVNSAIFNHSHGESIEIHVNGNIYNTDLQIIKDNDVNMYNLLIQQIKAIAEQFKNLK